MFAGAKFIFTMQTKMEKGFDKAFEVFNEKSMLESLHKRVKPKSFYNQHKAWKVFIEVLSYLFNFVSVSTTGLAAYLLVDTLGGHKILGIIIGIALVICIEILKRKSSSEMWQIWFFRRRFAKGWFLLSLSIAAFSVFSSGYGTKEGTNELTPDPELIAKSETLQSHYATVEKLDAEIADLRANKNSKGVTFYKLYPTIDAKTKTVEEYRAKILDLEEDLEGKNATLTDDYQSKVEITGWALVTVVVICEIAFELCIAYVWYFYFRSYVEKLIEEGEITNVQDFYTLIEKQEYIELSNSQKGSSTLPSGISGNQSMKSLNIGDNNDLLQQFEQLQQQLFAMQEMQANQALNQSEQRKGDSEQSSSKSVQSDLYSVEHTYMKNGETVTVHYTMPIIQSRIRQYDRELQDASTKGSSQQVIDNLSKKLGYWMDKKEELEHKLLAIA